MNLKSGGKKLIELGIGSAAVTVLALAGCGGGGGGGGSGSGNGGGTSGVTLSGLVSTFSGSALTPGIVDGASSVARFSNPAYIATDGTYLYLTDFSAANIRKIDIASGSSVTFAGSTTAVSGVTDGSGTNALFTNPAGVAIDGTNLYVADCANNNIRKIVLSGASAGTVSTYAGSTTGASGVADNATGLNARFNCPNGMTKLGSNLYVTDSNSHTIRQINLNTGAVSTFAGAVGGGYTTGYAGTSALFNFPSDITSDGTNLFVADCGNNNIRQINMSTGMVSTLAGATWKNISVPALGLAGSGVADGTGTTARFNCPQGITSDGVNLFVADTNSHTLRQVVISTGATSTLAGLGTASGVADGTSGVARFKWPSGVVLQNSSLYVADWGNSTVRKVK